MVAEAQAVRERVLRDLAGGARRRASRSRSSTPARAAAQGLRGRAAHDRRGHRRAVHVAVRRAARRPTRRPAGRGGARADDRGARRRDPPPAASSTCRSGRRGRRRGRPDADARPEWIEPAVGRGAAVEVDAPRARHRGQRADRRRSTSASGEVEAPRRRELRGPPAEARTKVEPPSRPRRAFGSSAGRDEARAADEVRRGGTRGEPAPSDGARVGPAGEAEPRSIRSSGAGRAEGAGEPADEATPGAGGGSGGRGPGGRGRSTRTRSRRKDEPEATRAGPAVHRARRPSSTRSTRSWPAAQARLADEQNEVLDLLAGPSRKGVDDLLPAADEHAARWAEVVDAALAGAAGPGAAWPAARPGLGRGPGRRAGRSLTAPLRDRIDAASSPPTATSTTSPTGCGPSTGSGRGQRLTDTSSHYASPPTPAGVFDATPSGAEVQWVVDPLGGRCPDCDDNVLGGDIAKGTEFPTGHTCAPGPPGCRCPGARGRRLIPAPIASPPMRAPDDMPVARRRNQDGAAPWLVVGAVLLFFLITSLRGIAGFYTDYLWFDSLGRPTSGGASSAPRSPSSVIFTAAFFVAVGQPRDRRPAGAPVPPAGPGGGAPRALPRAGRRPRRARAIGRLGCCSPSSPAPGCRASGTRGSSSPTPATSASRTRSSTPTSASTCSGCRSSPSSSTGCSPRFVIVLIVTAVAHYLNGGIRVQAPAHRVTPQVKAHLSVLLGVLALVKAAGYWLQRYELTVSTRGFVDGAGYTDVKAQLPAINLLLLIMLAASCCSSSTSGGGAGRCRSSASACGRSSPWSPAAIYPQFVQRVQVEPTEPEKEQPYIERNIEATTAAMGLDDVGGHRLRPRRTPTRPSTWPATPTRRNIRIWDPADSILGRPSSSSRRSATTTGQRRRRRPLRAQRRADPGGAVRARPERRGVPQQVVGGRAPHLHARLRRHRGAGQREGGSGEPAFVAEDVPYARHRPTTSSSRSPRSTSARTSAATSSWDPSSARSTSRTTRDDQFTPTRARTASPLDNVVKKAAFALRFGDLNPLISDQLTDSSRILYIRDIRERVSRRWPRSSTSTPTPTR